MTKTKITALLLVVIAILSFAACGKTEPGDLWADAIYTEDTALGTGACEFSLTVTAEDKSITLTVLSDEEYLGDALLALGVIEGTEGAYGLYIDKVNGILASWEADNAWWGVYVDGATATTGIDGIKIENGAQYELKYTK